MSDIVFVITRDGDVGVHKDVEDAEGYMEAIDVLDGEYVEAFTISGERLTISANENDYRVTVRRTGTVEPEVLVDRLRALADRNGYDGNNADLRSIANEILAGEWRMRWPRWPGWLDRRVHGDGPPTVS